MLVFIGWFLSDGFIGWFYRMVLSDGFVGWFYRVVLSDGFIGWFLSDGFIGWFYRVVLSGGFYRMVLFYNTYRYYHSEMSSTATHPISPATGLRPSGARSLSN
jgi:hypothetical protein